MKLIVHPETDKVTTSQAPVSCLPCSCLPCSWKKGSSGQMPVLRLIRDALAAPCLSDLAGEEWRLPARSAMCDRME